jgi:uncharacterized protein (TIGR00730 family)
LRNEFRLKHPDEVVQDKHVFQVSGRGDIHELLTAVSDEIYRDAVISISIDLVTERQTAEILCVGQRKALEHRSIPGSSVNIQPSGVVSHLRPNYQHREFPGARSDGLCSARKQTSAGVAHATAQAPSVPRICVFLGSSTGNGDEYLRLAEECARAIVRAGQGIVYGGGRIGLMGALADAALAAGGEVIGVIPESLERREVAHQGLSDLHVVAGMHERKALMASLSDAFVTLPGGIGTLDELFDILSWSVMGLHAKPIGLLNYRGFFDPLLAQLDNMVIQGFIQPEYRELSLSATTIDELLAATSSNR